MKKLITILSLSVFALMPLSDAFAIDYGNTPAGPMALASDGNFYGMTRNGGAYGHGTIFSVSTTGTMNLIYSFDGTEGVGVPAGGLVQGADGQFYGRLANPTQAYTGVFTTVFKVSTSGKFTICYLYNEGQIPEFNRTLALGSDGYIYGVQAANSIIFKISQNGAVSFPGTISSENTSDLIQASNGIFYGTTAQGGNGLGSIFSLSGNVVSTFFAFPSNGSYDNPIVPLVQGSDGALYGSALFGGTYKITTGGTLTNIPNNGDWYEGLISASDGNIYGDFEGGAPGEVVSSQATIFKMSTSGAFTNVINLTGLNGLQPYRMVEDTSNGDFYGVTEFGGSTFTSSLSSAGYGLGSVFQLTKAGTLTTLYSFQPSGPVSPAPDALSVPLNGTATFTTSFSGGPYTYQWYHLNGNYFDWNGNLRGNGFKLYDLQRHDFHRRPILGNRNEREHHCRDSELFS